MSISHALVMQSRMHASPAHLAVSRAAHRISASAVSFRTNLRIVMTRGLTCLEPVCTGDGIKYTFVCPGLPLILRFVHVSDLVFIAPPSHRARRTCMTRRHDSVPKSHGEIRVPGSQRSSSSSCVRPTVYFLCFPLSRRAGPFCLSQRPRRALWQRRYNVRSRPSPYAS